MGLSLEEKSLEDIKPRIIENVLSYASPIDSYYEDHVLGSKHFAMRSDGAERGYLSVFEGRMITQYRVDEPYLPSSEGLFDELLSLKLFSEAYVSTADEMLLPVALDHAKAIDVQDFVFQAGAPGGGDPRFRLRRALVADKACIEERHEGFFQDLDAKLAKGELYVGTYDDVIVSFGIIERSRLYAATASVGIFVIAKARGRNHGSMTARGLAELCRSDGIMPIAGCFSRNTYSRNALLKAGMYSVTRLLRITV